MLVVVRVEAVTLAGAVGGWLSAQARGGDRHRCLRRSVLPAASRLDADG